MLAAIDPWMPSAAAIAQGDGAREVAAFLDWARAAGVREFGLTGVVERYAAAIASLDA